MGQDPREPETVERARVESGDRGDPLARERDHEQAGRTKHFPGGVAGVDGERGLRRNGMSTTHTQTYARVLAARSDAPKSPALLRRLEHRTDADAGGNGRHERQPDVRDRRPRRRPKLRPRAAIDVPVALAIVGPGILIALAPWLVPGLAPPM